MTKIPPASKWAEDRLASQKASAEAAAARARAEGKRVADEAAARIRNFKPIMDYIERARKAGFKGFREVTKEDRESTYYRIETETWPCDDYYCAAGYGVGLDGKGFFTWTYREASYYSRNDAYYYRTDHKTRKEALARFLEMAR